MGFDLNAFLGRASELRTWKGRLPSAVVCPLGGELGMVPVTEKLFQELRDLLGEEEANRLDAQDAPVYPGPSRTEGARPPGVVRSNASEIEAKPTPSAVSSCKELMRSRRDRPQRSSRQTGTRSISRRRAARSSSSRRGRI